MPHHHGLACGWVSDRPVWEKKLLVGGLSSSFRAPEKLVLRRARQSSSVVLPLPDGPRIAVNDPLVARPTVTPSQTKRVRLVTAQAHTSCR